MSPSSRMHGASAILFSLKPEPVITVLNYCKNFLPALAVPYIGTLARIMAPPSSYAGSGIPLGGFNNNNLSSSSLWKYALDISPVFSFPLFEAGKLYSKWCASVSAVGESLRIPTSPSRSPLAVNLLFRAGGTSGPPARRLCAARSTSTHLVVVGTCPADKSSCNSFPLIGLPAVNFFHLFHVSCLLRSSPYLWSLDSLS